MTELDMIIQELRRNVAALEAEIKELRDANESLKLLHKLDMSEIARLRRMVEAEVDHG